jgi:uncharacterized membrane protein
VLGAISTYIQWSIEPIFLGSLLVLFLALCQFRETLSGLVRSLILGGICGVFLFLIKKYWVRLEIVDVLEKGLLLLALLLLFGWLLSFAKKQNRKGLVLFYLFGFLYAMEQIQDLLAMVWSLLSLENGFHSGWVLALSGVLSGIVLVTVVFLAVLKVGEKVTSKRIFLFLLFMTAFILLKQSIEFLQLLLGLQLLPLTLWLLDILMPFVNHKNIFHFIILGINLCFVLVLLTHAYQLFRDKDDLSANPANKRKRLASKLYIRRWAYCLGTAFFLMSFFFLGQQIDAAKSLDIKPPKSVADQAGSVHVDTKGLAEKELQLYSYKSSDQTEVRFLVVRKMGENYGVALDACNMCGVAGYYEKDGQIICKKCQSVVNMTTIGFKGGCNPIPLQYEQKSQGMLEIPTFVLEKAKNTFQKGGE